jgi:SAM-dependent methyltransferase
MEKVGQQGSDAHFSAVAEKYRELRTTDDEPIYYIRGALAGRASIQAADIGCGAGRYDLLLLQLLPNLHLTCVDINAEMLAELSDFLTENGVRHFRTLQSSVEDLALDDSSLDCILSFNAVHHFDFPTFLDKARNAVRPGGRIFVYTRTPEQNTQSVWGRYFPGFAEIETRLFTAAEMERWVAEAPGLHLVATEDFHYDRVASVERLGEQARGKHYSTFDLYEPEAFETALASFVDDVGRAFPDPGRVTWHDENTLLNIERHGD